MHVYIYITNDTQAIADQPVTDAQLASEQRRHTDT